MNQHSTQENELRRYLLGDLKLEERLTVEERLFLDEEYLQLLKAVEENLLDEYAYHELTAGERKKLETHFLPEPGRHGDLKLAQALRRYVTSEAQPAGPQPVPPGNEVSGAAMARDAGWLSYLFGRRPILGYSFAALLLLLLGGLIWLAAVSVLKPGRTPAEQVQEEQVPPRQEPGERRPEQANGNAPGEGGQSNREQRATLPAPVVEEAPAQEREAPQPHQARGPSPQDTPEPGRTLALLLPPGGVVREDGETNNLNIASDVGIVVLQLALVEREDYRSYRASLLSGARTIYARAGLKLAAVGDVKVVPLKVPARLLRRQSYEVKLSGLALDGRVQEIASYSFRIGKR